jgi:hypothetical protein
MPLGFDKNFGPVISKEDSLISWWLPLVYVWAIVHGISKVGPESYPPDSLEPAYKAYSEGKISGNQLPWVV